MLIQIGPDPEKYVFKTLGDFISSNNCSAAVPVSNPADPRRTVNSVSSCAGCPPPPGWHFTACDGDKKNNKYVKY